MKTLTQQEANKVVPTWKFENDAIQKDFSFKDFKDAFCFMTKIAFYAEVQNHHPEWTNVYNKVSITLNTHTSSGVTEKDIELAKLIDKIII